jgi:hypothetical protein
LVAGFTIFSEHRLERGVVEHLIGQELLEFAVLVLESAEARGLVDLHSAVLGSSAVEGRGRDAEAAGDLGGLGAGIDLTQRTNDLLVGELTLAGHVRLLK